MTTLEEIEAALGVIAFGYTAPAEAQPGIEAFRKAYASAAGQQALKDKVTLLHCTTEYPAPVDDIHLRAMDVMRSTFALPVGYSDHSEGILIPVAAVARGACIIEKHFTLDKTMEGPDHKASLEPQELKDMVSAIRLVEKALGSASKQPQPSEIKNIPIARKSLVAAKNITAGDFFTKDNIAVKRPGTGASPYRYWELLGKKSSSCYQQGEHIVE
jgi:sialic acid synthase SpsE